MDNTNKYEGLTDIMQEMEQVYVDIWGGFLDKVFPPIDESVPLK